MEWVVAAAAVSLPLLLSLSTLLFVTLFDASVPVETTLDADADAVK